MRIPRKIDDRLKDAIVNVQFQPGIPGNAVEGAFFTLCKGEFQVVTIGQSNAIQIDQLIIQPQQSFYVHRDGKFRVDINANSITFNLIDGYAGWREYFTIIRSTLSALFDAKIISRALRVGVRYISVFDQQRIFDQIIPELNFNPFDETSSRAQFRIELPRQDFLVILTLINAFPKTVGDDVKEIYSVIDIDTFKLFEPMIESGTDLLKWLDGAHDEQKEVFFSLLKQEFVDSLNPLY